MEIRVLGCHGSQLPGHGLTGFLIDEMTLLDAGAVTSVLTLEEQARIENILITHAHLDHVREIASLAENLSHVNRVSPLKVVGTPRVIEALKTHIFNGTIWPDFSIIPNPENPILMFVSIPTEEKVQFGRLRVTAIPVHHAVETVAYLVETESDERSPAVIFIGDTGPTEEIWRVAKRNENVRAVFVETSLPERMKVIAALTGHLTTAGLLGELKKLGPVHTQIYLHHMKAQYYEEIQREIALMGNANIHVLRDGQVIRI